jgi:hypothetical protein
LPSFFSAAETVPPPSALRLPWGHRRTEARQSNEKRRYVEIIDFHMIFPKNIILLFQYVVLLTQVPCERRLWKLTRKIFSANEVQEPQQAMDACEAE